MLKLWRAWPTGLRAEDLAVPWYWDLGSDDSIAEGFAGIVKAEDLRSGTSAEVLGRLGLC